MGNSQTAVQPIPTEHQQSDESGKLRQDIEEYLDEANHRALSFTNLGWLFHLPFFLISRRRVRRS